MKSIWFIKKPSPWEDKGGGSFAASGGDSPGPTDGKLPAGALIQQGSASKVNIHIVENLTDFHFRRSCFYHRLLGEVWISRKKPEAKLFLGVWKAMAAEELVYLLKGLLMKATAILKPITSPGCVVYSLCWFTLFKIMDLVQDCTGLTFCSFIYTMLRLTPLLWTFGL